MGVVAILALGMKSEIGFSQLSLSFPFLVLSLTQSFFLFIAFLQIPFLNTQWKKS